jgi:hypothetical protein
MNQPKKRGRQPDANSKSGKIRELLATGIAASEIAKKVGCTPALVYNVKARMSGGVRQGRKPGRPSNAAKARHDGLAGLAGILDAVKNSERERTQLRSVLERLRAVVADALA